MEKPRLVLLFAVLCLPCFEALSFADPVQFIRGDANSDGKVSLADSHFISLYIFQGGQSSDCFSAMDVNSRGDVDITDIAIVIAYLFGNASIPLPFPVPGPDPQGSPLGCAAYGGGSTIVDGLSRIEVAEAIAPGGDDPSAIISVKIFNLNPLAGFSGKIVLTGSLVGELSPKLDCPQNLNQSPNIDPQSPSPNCGLHDAHLVGEAVLFGLMIHVDSRPLTPIPAGEGDTILNIPVCLLPGTKAGEYLLALEAGELIDLQTGKSIQPVLAGARLTVLQDVSTSADCTLNDPPAEVVPVNVAFKMADGSGVPGGTAAIPFLVRADKPVQGFAFSVDFDESILQVESVERIWNNPDGSEIDYEALYFNNDNVNEADHGIAEGFAIGVLVPSHFGRNLLPPDQDVPVYRLHFQVNPEAPIGTTEIAFVDGGDGPGQPVRNAATIDGRSVFPETTLSFLFINGLLQIIADGIPFRRGEINSDKAADITDAALILQHLFLGEVELSCQGAADLNADGDLDITDPIYLLRHLFLGSAVPPEPFKACAKDRGENRLPCESFPLCD